MNHRSWQTVFVALSIILLLGGVFYGRYRQQHNIPQKPLPSQPEVTPQPEWYIQFTVKNQKITAYTESSTARRAASGQHYSQDGIAVHPIYPGVDPRIPLIPFDTIIWLNEPIEIHGQTYDSFRVIDTGDIYYGLWGNKPYWFDIYYGTANYYNNKGAREFGVQERDYNWVEKWR